MAQLSERDKQLSPEAQKEILAAKDAWAAAKTDEERAAANKAANDARSKYGGYTAGADGTGYAKDPVKASGQGGRDYTQMAADMDAYKRANQNYGSDKYYGPNGGWTNGYSTAMNVRSMANEIRQQMEANSKAWHTADAATKEYLHAQNVELAKLLPGGTTNYNESTGRWETWNPNVGYGYDMNGTQENIRNAWKQYYGYTDQQIDNWAKDNSRYYNFVDTRAPARNTIDETGGFTGQYAQFANGPYASLLGGTRGKPLSQFTDVIGDRFGDEGTFMSTPVYDENGNIIKYTPALKGNNSASDYSRQFIPVADSGVLSGSGERVDAMDKTTGENNISGQRDYIRQYGGYGLGAAGNSGVGTGSLSGYIDSMYAAALQSQLNALESGYKQNISELDANIGKVNDTYTEQKRQTTGTNEQDAAAWREMANAMGLNTGAVGQAALAQNNQLQSNLNALEKAEASALTEIERQKALLGQQYQLQINQAIAENDFNRAQALYQEAVRAEEQLIQKQQYASQMALKYAQLAQDQAQYENNLALQYAKANAKNGSQSFVPGMSDKEKMREMFLAAEQSGIPVESWLENKEYTKAYGMGGFSADALRDIYFSDAWRQPTSNPTTNVSNSLGIAYSNAETWKREGKTAEEITYGLVVSGYDDTTIKNVMDKLFP